VTARETVTRSGPSVLDCIEAAMRADPSLTIEEAIRTVPVSQQTIDRLSALEQQDNLGGGQ